MTNKLVAVGIALFALMIVIVIIFYAMTKGNSGTTKPTSSNKNSKVTLTVWRTFDDDTSFKQLIDNFNQDNSNITINYVKKDLADYEVQSINSLAAGNGPDIWSINSQWIPRHLDKIIPMPTDFVKSKKDPRSNTDFYKQTFAKVAQNDNIVDDKVYGMPLYVDTLALYVNTQLWDEARNNYRKQFYNDPNFDDSLFRRYPSTWEELLKELPYLTKKDASGNISQAGIAMGTSNNITSSADIVSLLMLQNGTKMTDDTRQSARFNTFVSDSSNKPVYTGTNALDFYTSFARKDKSNYTWSGSMLNAYQSFINGKVAILVGYQYISQSLRQDAPTLQYEVSYMPQVKGADTINYASYWTETVTNNCKNPNEAWKFLQYISTHANSYLRSTRRSSALIADPSNPITYDVFTDQVQSAVTWNKGKHSEDVDKIFEGMITNVTVNSQPPQQAIDAAAQSVTDALQKE